MNAGMEDFFEGLEPETQEAFHMMAEGVAAWGYKPQRAKTKELTYIFTHPKIQKHILKFTKDKHGVPTLKMKFFASQEYSSLFDQAIKRTLEKYGFKYVGCYGCRRCDGTVGYTVVYPDGRQYFRCGREAIDIGRIAKEDVPEALALLRKQHEYDFAGIQ